MRCSIFSDVALAYRLKQSWQQLKRKAPQSRSAVQPSTLRLALTARSLLYWWETTMRTKIPPTHETRRSYFRHAPRPPTFARVRVFCLLVCFSLKLETIRRLCLEIRRWMKMLRSLSRAYSLFSYSSGVQQQESGGRCLNNSKFGWRKRRYMSKPTRGEKSCNKSLIDHL